MMQDLQRVLAAYWQQFVFLSPKLLVALVVLAVAVPLASRLSRLIGTRLERRAHDPLLADFLARFSRWVFLFAGGLLALEIVGLYGVVGGMLGGLGLSAFLVGFAFKDIAENFLAGVILAFNRPFHINDTVQIRDQVGHVEALNLRTTLIRTFDGKHVFLPNSLVLKEPLTNFTRDGHLRQDFLLSVERGPDSHLDQVHALLLNFLHTHPQVPQEAPRAPYLVLEKTTPTAADLRLYFWTAAEEYRRGTLVFKSELMQAAQQAATAAGYTVTAVAQ